MRTVLVPFVLVFGAAVVVLRVADWMPLLAGGEPRGARRFDSVEALERATGTRLLLPAYFPDTLGWPPARVRLALGHPPTASVRFAARGPDEVELTVSQTLGGHGTIPDWLVAPGQVLLTSEVTVAGREAHIVRVEEASGRLVHDVQWESADRTVRLRFSGPVEQLVLMAESVERARR